MTHYTHARPTARKTHRCMLCARIIRPGEQYLRGAGMDGSHAWTWKECAHCDAIRDVARAAVYDDEYDDDLIGEWDPETLAHLRLKAMWKRQWTKRDGTLWPVPRKVHREDAHGFSWQHDVEAVS